MRIHSSVRPRRNFESSSTLTAKSEAGRVLTSPGPKAEVQISANAVNWASMSEAPLHVSLVRDTSLPDIENAYLE